MSIYISSLQAMEYLLDKVDEKQWRDWIRVDIKWWNEKRSVEHHLQAYGGMGSFNDVAICRLNGHKVDLLLEPWIDVLFNWLKSICFTLARHPMEVVNVNDLKKIVGYYDATLSAFIGSENATSAQRGMIEFRPSLEGWRCLDCGFGEIDQAAINYYIARSILPQILFSACVRNKLISVIDGVFEQSLLAIQELDFRIRSLIKKASVNFVQERNSWMRPCPSCSSDNTAVYRWLVESDKLISADNNLPIKRNKWCKWW